MQQTKETYPDTPTQIATPAKNLAVPTMIIFSAEMAGAVLKEEQALALEARGHQIAAQYLGIELGECLSPIGLALLEHEQNLRENGTKIDSPLKRIEAYLPRKTLDFGDQVNNQGRHRIRTRAHPTEAHPMMLPLGNTNCALFVQNVEVEQGSRTKAVDPLVARVAGRPGSQSLRDLASHAQRTRKILVEKPNLTMEEVVGCGLEHQARWYQMVETAARSEEVRPEEALTLAKLARLNHGLWLRDIPSYVLASTINSQEDHQNIPDIIPPAYKKFLLSELPPTGPVWITINTATIPTPTIEPLENLEEPMASYLKQHFHPEIEMDPDGIVRGSFCHPDVNFTESLGEISVGQMRYIGMGPGLEELTGFGGLRANFIANLPTSENVISFLERSVHNEVASQIMQSQVHELGNSEVFLRQEQEGFRTNLWGFLKNQPAF